MKRLLIAILLLNCLKTNAQLVNVGVVAGAHFNLGTQFNGIDFQLGAIATFYESGGFGADLAGNLNYQLYWKKFGRQIKAHSLIYELKTTMGSGNPNDFIGLANGISANHYFFENSPTNRYNAAGFSWNKTQHFGALKKFSSARGGFLMRFSANQNHFLVNFNNDFRAGFMRGKATDYGETGSLTFKYLVHRDFELHTIGSTIELITPEPDYSKKPDAKGNSDFESKIVTSPKGAFPKLYHGNLFGFYNYQSAFAFGEVAMGVDSKKAGAFIQNVLHDYFALYPRFEWPIQEKAKLYLQIKGGTQVTNKKTL